MWGDTRVVDRFRRALFEDYRGQYLTDDDGLALCSLVSLLGHVARRHPEALALLRQGLNEEFWVTRIPWWWQQGDIPMPLQEILVVSAISGLARSGRDEAWEWVLEKKRENNPRYLERYAKFMVEAAARRRYLLDYGPAYPTTDEFNDFFFPLGRDPGGAGMAEVARADSWRPVAALRAGPWNWAMGKWSGYQCRGSCPPPPTTARGTGCTGAGRFT